MVKILGLTEEEQENLPEVVFSKEYDKRAQRIATRLKEALATFNPADYGEVKIGD